MTTERGPNSIKLIQRRFETLGTLSMTRKFSTGPDESSAIEALWTGEVDSVIKALGFTARTLDFCLETKISMLTNDGLSDKPAPKESDDFLKRLIFNETQTLVSMENTRNGRNMQVVQVARFPLLPIVYDDLEQLINLDEEYRRAYPEDDDPRL